MSTNHTAIAAQPPRVSIVADAQLVDALREHQRRVQDETGLKVSTSQLAGALLRRALSEAPKEPAR